ncbi:MAG: sugar phosphate nucleotidyltransferase [Nanoarchaeota archaeon]
MQVVILCGGKGTRMGSLTAETPKPLLKIGDKAVLWHLMKRFSAFGYNEFILCLGYLGEQIKDYFSQKENQEDKWKIHFVDTGLESTKSERISKVQPLIDGDHFLLSYGDDLSAVDVPALVNFHLRNNKTVTLTSVPLHSQFGVLELNEYQHVKKFREKPRLAEYWINGGFYVCNKQVLQHLHIGEFEDKVLPELAEQGEVIAFKFEGFWKSMNTNKDVLEFKQLLESGAMPWKNW